MVKKLVNKDVETAEKRKRSKPTGRKPLAQELPVERIELPPPVDTEGLVQIGEEVSETVEWRSASLVRVQVVRPKYASQAGDSGVVVAEPPEKPIPKSKAGPGMLAQVIVSKYADHLPLHRCIVRRRFFAPRVWSFRARRCRAG